MAQKNPWLGLTTYSEGQHLYGRSEEITYLSHDIIYNRQTVVYGKSGIGKSSLLNAGVFPLLRKAGMFPVNVRLVHNADGASYFSQIKKSVEESISHLRRETLDSDGKTRILDNLQGRIEEICPSAGRDGEESLWEYFHRHVFYDDRGNEITPVIVFDQFEEIFTLCKSEQTKLDFFNDLADFINDVPPAYIYESAQKAESEDKVEDIVIDGSDDFILLEEDEEDDNAKLKYLTEARYHIVITLREDFLSYLERYTLNIPLLKHNRYCLRPLSDDQAAIIIMDPVPGLVSTRVAEEIICKVADAEIGDFVLGDGVAQLEVDSAILSLFLSELFIHKGKDETKISLELVRAIGDDIIKSFYERTIEKVPRKSIEYLEDALITDDGRRDSKFESDVLRDEVNPQDLKYLKNQRLIHEYPWNDDIRIEFMHDILCPVIVKRKQERENARKAEEERKAQERETQRLLAEEESKRKALEQKAAQEKAEMEAETLRIKKRNRRRIYTSVAIASLIALVIGALWLNEYLANEHEFVHYYAAFNEDNHGWPTGVGKELSDKELSITPLYYKLSYKGYKNKDRFSDVEIMTSNRYLPNDRRVNSLEWSVNEDGDKAAKAYNEVLRKVKHIHYTAIEGSDKISKVEYMDEYPKDEKANLLMTVSYYHLTDNDAWANFITPQGQSMRIRDNGIDRVKISWDPNGVQAVKYYDALGVQQDIFKGRDIKGFEWRHPDENTVVMYSLNEFGLPTQSTSDNTKVTINRNDTTYVQYFNTRNIPESDSLWMVNVTEVRGRDGYSKSVKFGDTTKFYQPGTSTESCTQTITQRDDNGNITEIRTIGDEIFGFSPIVKRSYSDGLLNQEEQLTLEGNPFSNDSTRIYKKQYAYYGDVLRGETYYNTDEVIVYGHSKETNISQKDDTITIEKTIDIHSTVPYLERIDSVRNNYTSITFYGKDGQRENHQYMAGKDTLMVHRILQRRDGPTLTYTYFIQNHGRIEPMDASFTDYGKALSYFKRVEEYDDNNNLVALRLEDQEGKILKNMMYFIQNGQCIGRAVRSIIDDNPVRCDRWEEEGYLYYRFYFNTDFEGNNAGLTAVNEWGDRSPAYNGESYLFAKLFDFYDKYVVIYDKNDLVYPVWETEFKNNYKQLAQYEDEELTDFTVPYLHILSQESKLYNNGNCLRDGDIIVELGDWQLSQKRPLDRTWEKVLSTGGTAHVKVLRPNVPANSYDVLEFDLPFDNNEKDRVEYHPLKMTFNEKEMFEKFYDVTM